MTGTSFLLPEKERAEEFLARLESGKLLTKEEFEELLAACGREPDGTRYAGGDSAGGAESQHAKRDAAVGADRTKHADGARCAGFNADGNEDRAGDWHMEFSAELRRRADRVRRREYGNKVFIRGLIECTNYCKNNCYYCGIRRDNRKAERYRLTKEEILECCAQGQELGFRTFVLQGGEDGWYTDERLIDLIREIKRRFPECALTLSLGEKSRASYEAYFEAGTDRYLLRHETADGCHYAKLHPEEMSMENRMRCLRDLKEIGYQTGAGMMVGSPGQTLACLAEDLVFLQTLRPEMVGIGPFLPHHDTPFAKEAAGSVELTLDLLAIVRLMLPKVLLPATTALGTAEADGRERGMRCGANVVMPNLSPASVRSKYSLYDNKRAFGSEAAEGLKLLKESMAAAGFEVVTDRGDYLGFECRSAGKPEMLKDVAVGNAQTQGRKT